MKPPRVVLDTNVVVSALCFGGPPAKILELALAGRISLATSAALAAELQRVLRDKFPGREPALAETLGELSSIWELVSTAGRAKLAVIKADPDDDRVLECALAAKAELIVSGDKHLLELEKFQAVRILTPRRFLQEFE